MQQPNSIPMNRYNAPQYGQTGAQAKGNHGYELRPAQIAPQYNMGGGMVPGGVNLGVGAGMDSITTLMNLNRIFIDQKTQKCEDCNCA